MPIITTLEITRSCLLRWPRRKCSANHSWATISPVVRLREKPWWPVEQKRQPTAHPAWDEMQSVPRSSSGMKTASTALPSRTSNSHLIVPSADSCWVRTGSASMRAVVLSFSRNDFAKSVIWSKSRAPRWWIQRNSWVARKRFSPSVSQNAANPSRSKSRRLAVIPWVLLARSARVDVHAGEEERDFDGGRLGRVGAVHGVGVDAVGEVGADGALLGLLGIGGTHQLAVLADGALALQHLDHHRAGDHEVNQVLEERTRLVHGIELLRFLARQVRHPGGDHLQARA